jgi:hypothetical protein
LIGGSSEAISITTVVLACTALVRAAASPRKGSTPGDLGRPRAGACQVPHIDCDWLGQIDGHAAQRGSRLVRCRPMATGRTAPPQALRGERCFARIDARRLVLQ